LAYLASGKSISVGYFYLKKVQQTVDQRLEQTDYDAIICFSSPMAEYIFRTPSLRHRFANHQSYISKPFLPNPKSLPAIASAQARRTGEIRNWEPARKVGVRRTNPKLVMDFCDVDSDKWAQYATLTSFPKSFIYTLENHRLARYEKKIAEHFDHSIFVSQKEAEILSNQNPHLTNITVIPNGVDYKYFAPQKRHTAQGARYKDSSSNALNLEPCALCPKLMFAGAMDYYANVDGVTWFCEEIFPGIKASLPEAQFYIVGSNPCQEIRNLGNGDGIRVTGFVEDIRPFYEKADICVIPLRLARGIQNKVLEAMSMEKAAITTSQAIQGITAVDGEHLAVADEPKDFAQAVVTLHKDTNRRRTLEKNARRFVKTNYNWQTNMKKLEKLISRGVGSPESEFRIHKNHSSLDKC
jgi:sugar transferase (PEP-CTERM/EpsH1 system associated)